jgi:maltodextrin utilization protein YvdJ
MRTLNEQVSRIKQMMNINEDDSQMALIQQETQEFNEKVGEELTPEEYKEVVCLQPDDIDLPTNITSEEKQKVELLKEKIKTASVPELMKLKQQLKELKKQTRQQNEQAQLVTLLGVSMPSSFALVIGGIIFVMVLTILSRFFRIRKTETYWCDGKKSHLFGLLRW